MAQREQEMKELKKQIDRDLDDVLENGNQFQNGRLELPGVAMISIAMNPPRLLWTLTGDTLNVTDKEGLSLVLPEKFMIRSIRLPEMAKAIDRGDKSLTALLGEKGIELAQDSRFDIKPA